MKKILGAIMAIVGVAFVCTYVFGGGLASLINIDFSSGDSFALGKIIGQLLVALVGIALIYYGLKFWTERKWVLVVILVGVGVGFADVTISNGPKDSDIISGAARTDFVNGAIQSCLESSNNAFCTCYANKVADEMSYADITEIKKNGSVPSDVQSRLDAASQSCATSLQ